MSRLSFAVCRAVSIVAALVLLPCLAVAGNNPLKWDNVIGLTVNIQDSGGTNCEGTDAPPQVVSDSARLTGGEEGNDCSGGATYTIAVTVTGKVETQNAAYDFVYVNGVLFFSGDEAGGGCAMATKTETREITVSAGDTITLTYDTADDRYHTGAYATITGIQLIDSGCNGNCTPGSGSVENGSVEVGMRLGRTEFGKSAGALRVAEHAPSAALGTPASLHYSSAWDDVVVVLDGNGDIQQITAPQTLADVVVESPVKFRVDFYDPDSIGPLVGDLHDQSGETPFVSWSFENLDPVDHRHLRVVETRGTSAKTSNYVWPPTGQGWELVTGGGQRKHRKTIVDNPVNATSTVTEEVRDGADALVSKTVHVYKDFPWGRELVQTTLDPDGAALVTTRDFHTSSGGAYGRLKSVQGPHGGWATHSYDAQGRRTKTVEPFRDAVFNAADNLCKVTTVAYSAMPPHETEVVKILGQEVERRYRVFLREAGGGAVNHETRDIVCTVAGAAYNAPTNLVTTTRLVDRGPFVGEPESVDLPDGSARRYSYFLEGSNKRTMLYGGHLDELGNFVQTTTTSTLVDAAGNLIEETVTDLASGLVVGGREILQADAFGRPEQIAHTDGTLETFVYGCCGLQSHTDRDGVVTEYVHDAFGRVILETRAGLSTATTYDAEGRVLTRSRIGADQSVIVTETNVYDLAGRLVSRTDALDQTTTFAELVNGSGQLVHTETFAGDTRVGTFHRDGRRVSVAGSMVRPQCFLYGVDGNGYYEQTVAGTSPSGTEWTRDSHDLAGRVVRSARNGAGHSTRHYDARGRLVKEVDPDGVSVRFAYHPDGTLHRRYLDLNRNDALDGGDPLAEFGESYLQAHGETVLRRETRVYDDADNAHLALREDRSLDGRRTWTERWGLTTTRTLVPGPGQTATETLVHPDGSQTVRTYAQGRLLSETTTADGGTLAVSSRTYGYDPHGRLSTIADARNGTTAHVHDDLDRIVSATAPAPGPGLPAPVTAYEYDARGRVVKTVHPDLSETVSTYSPAGDLLSQSGAGTPTLAHTYDPQGRLKTLVTTGQAGPATTTWNYHAQTGRLVSKTDDAGKSTTYTYTDAGRLLTRTWARGAATAYAYDWGGRHTGTTHDAQPFASHAYNRLGQVHQLTDAAGTRDFTHTPDGRLLVEETVGGILDGLTVTHAYDALHRRIGYTATMAGSTHSIAYGYDGASRLLSVASGDDEAIYARFANSPHLETLLREHDGGITLATAYTRDFLDRLVSIDSTTGAGTLTSHSYTYNLLGRRTAAERQDGSRWDYAYDGDGQLLSASRQWADTAPVAGQQFAYAYDGIGNRTVATANGRESVHTSNLLNQYTQRTVPGAIDVRGSSLASAVVVNDGVATRQGDYFHRAVPVDNAAAPQHPQIKVQALDPGAGPGGADLKAEEIGRAYLPKTPEAFTYDFDGNLTGDGRWVYTWDYDNRLIAMESAPSVPATAKRKLEFAYDSRGRRIRKRVHDWNGTAYVLAGERRYAYDGWNLVAEIVASPTPFVRTYVWGLDLSVTEQGAGGVGGLLAIQENGESHYPAYDGNGNVMALVRGSDGAVSGRYEYGPFGEILEVEESGIENPFRFSTKFQDGETGLLYYGFRYYNPETGRWLSRDPIEERGGVNLYGFVGNNGVGKVDILGLLTDVDLEILAHARNPAGQGLLGAIYNQLRSVPPITISSDRIGLLRGDAANDLFKFLNEKACVCKSFEINDVIGVQTEHIWSIGRMSVRVVGTFISRKSSGRDKWSFKGKFDPQNDRFDFSPLIDDRDPPIVGDFVNSIGWGAEKLGVFGTFDILFTGPVSVDWTRYRNCDE